MFWSFVPLRPYITLHSGFCTENDSQREDALGGFTDRLTLQLHRFLHKATIRTCDDIPSVAWKKESQKHKRWREKSKCTNNRKLGPLRVSGSSLLKEQLGWSVRHWHIHGQDKTRWKVLGHMSDQTCRLCTFCVSYSPTGTGKKTGDRHPQSFSKSTLWGYTI